MKHSSDQDVEDICELGAEHLVQRPGALSQKWFPLRHDEQGTTVGSINLGYKYVPGYRKSFCDAQLVAAGVSIA